MFKIVIRVILGYLVSIIDVFILNCQIETTIAVECIINVLSVSKCKYFSRL